MTILRTQLRRQLKAEKHKVQDLSRCLEGSSQLEHFHMHALRDMLDAQQVVVNRGREILKEQKLASRRSGGQEHLSPAPNVAGSVSEYTMTVPSEATATPESSTLSRRQMASRARQPVSVERLEETRRDSNHVGRGSDHDDEEVNTVNMPITLRILDISAFKKHHARPLNILETGKEEIVMIDAKFDDNIISYAKAKDVALDIVELDPNTDSILIKNQRGVERPPIGQVQLGCRSSGTRRAIWVRCWVTDLHMHNHLLLGRPFVAGLEEARQAGR